MKKEISLGDVLAILLAACGIFAGYYSHDKRIAVLERADADIRVYKQELREDLRRIESAIVDIRDRLPPKQK